MTVRRSDIERALDDIISNEEGMKFQGLAVVLAKKRWPALIACERKKDMGADALAKAPFAAEGKGMVLACSTTATLEKIRSDAEKIKTHFPNITKLIFATPSAVTNLKADPWVAEVEKDFGYALAIMPREDILTSLMDPDNAGLLQSHLGIHVDIEPALSSLVQRVKEAADEVTASWFKRVAGKPLFNLRALRLDPAGRDSSEILQLDQIGTALLRGARVVLEGPAGRGKTTTLIQLAQAQSLAGSIPVLIDLTAWTATKSGIFAFVAGMPQFQSRSLDAQILARVNAVTHFSFLLNGWNEIAEPEFQQAESALRTLERDFPAAGIIVATRTHHIVPPVPGAARARLLTLTRRERASYLKARLGVSADDLRQKLDGDPVLDELTRTPFFLSEVCALHEAGVPIPATKIGVLDAVTRLVEQSDEHRNHLQQPPLSGRARDYLGELAARMTAQGGVSIIEDKARPAVVYIGKSLKEAGLIAGASEPDPGSVLGMLCARHVLERQDYPETAFRFEHQQFQEFYAAVGAGKRLLEALPEGQDEKRREFARLYVNEPSWAEPLRLIADDVRGRSGGADGAAAVQEGTLLVSMALMADPVFAAELSRLCGPLVWKEVRSDVGDRVRELYAGGSHYRNLALTGMLASGSDDFRDILEPILSGNDQQQVLGLYRRWDQFSVSSLGPSWQKTVSRWTEEARIAFVSENLHHRNDPEITAFALADPSNKVKDAAIQGLTWIGADEDAARFLSSLDAPTFDQIAASLPPDFVPIPVRARVIAAWEKSHEAGANPIDRVSSLLKLRALGAPVSVDQLKNDLDGVTGKIDGHRAHYVIEPALTIVRSSDASWASAWIAVRVADGSLWHEPWGEMITTAPEGLKQALLQKLETENLSNTPFGNAIAVLAPCADAPLVERVFKRLCAIRRVIIAAPEQRHEVERTIERQLEALWRALPPAVSVAGISSSFSKLVDGIELDVITRVFSSVARSGPDFDSLQIPLRNEFRAYLKTAIAYVLQQDDFSGEVKANVGSVLASVGTPEDLKEMSELVRADIERVRRGQAARAKGDRGTPGNGGYLSYAAWHIRSVVRLDPENADALLTSLLNEPEYERDVAAEFVKLVTPPVPNGALFRKVDYKDIWAARAGLVRTSQGDRRKRYAAALSDRIRAILKELAGLDQKQKRPYEFRLRVLGAALAKIDGRGSADLVYEVMSLPDEWDNYGRIEAFDALLFDGVVLPTDVTLNLLNPCLDRCRRYGVQQQDEGPVKRFLCLLPFVDDPDRGFDKLRTLISELRIFAHNLRDVVEAVGHSRCEQALPFLIELTSSKSRAEQLGDAWINAVTAVDSPESRSLLLSFIDPELRGMPDEIVFSKEHVLIARIVELAQRDPAIEQRLLALCEKDLPPAKRLLLAKVIGYLGGLPAITAGLRLINDRDSAPVPFEIWKLIEDAFVERRPHSGDANVFTLEPRSSNAIRMQLLDMASNDERRKKSALNLLAQIEEWRQEYGRPAGEPRNPGLESGQPWPPMPKTVSSPATSQTIPSE